MNTEAYLKRINYTGSLKPTEDTLRNLQLAHLRSVPFENLSIHVGEPIVLEDEVLFGKIVEKRRGGFCYELNGLFAALLRSLGFAVDMLAARVANKDGGFGPNFDHMALLVKLSEPWLVDVGFGDSFLEPLRAGESGVQEQGSRGYQITGEGDHFTLFQRLFGEDWEAEYRFTLQAHVYADYDEMCRYHQTSPDSHFTQGRICSLATEEGRITLSDLRLITTSGSGGQQLREERTLADEQEFAGVLADRFGIVMSDML